MSQPCLCGAEDCRYCFPNNFQHGRYIDREAIAEQEAKELLEKRLKSLERIADELYARCEDDDAEVLQGIYDHLQKE